MTRHDLECQNARSTGKSNALHQWECRDGGKWCSFAFRSD